MNYCKHKQSRLISVFALFLVSCTTQPPAQRSITVSLTNSVNFPLLPAAAIEKKLDGVQQITGNYGSRNFIIDALVKADENGIDMVFFNSMGAGMGDFSFSDQHISFNAPLIPFAFKPEYLAADFQFCFYRSEVLEPALKSRNLDFTVSEKTGKDGERVEIRRIAEKNKTIIEIEKTGAEVRYANFLRGYAYTLTGDM